MGNVVVMSDIEEVPVAAAASSVPLANDEARDSAWYTTSSHCKCKLVVVVVVVVVKGLRVVVVAGEPY